MFGNSTSNTQVFTGSVLVTGSMGIGTTTPAELLEVFAPAIAGTSQQARLRIAQAGSISARALYMPVLIQTNRPRVIGLFYIFHNT